MGIENHIPEGMGIISYQDLLEEIERELKKELEKERLTLLYLIKSIKLLKREQQKYNIDEAYLRNEYNKIIRKYKEWYKNSKIAKDLIPNTWINSVNNVNSEKEYQQLIKNFEKCRKSIVQYKNTKIKI